MICVLTMALLAAEYLSACGKAFPRMKRPRMIIAGFTIILFTAI
jgi:hypothetical protein